MHVLMVICQGGWMPIHLSEGWRQLGAQVTEFFYGTTMGKNWQRGGLRENLRLNQELWETAAKLKADGRLDLIFAVIYDDVLTVETVQKLRTLQIPLVNYHVDLVGQWYRVLRTGQYFDVVACAQRDHWQPLRKGGITPYYMPMAANPPINNQSTNLADNLGTRTWTGVRYLGSPWLYRQEVLQQLHQHQIPLEIYGRNWHKVAEVKTDQSHQYVRKNLHDLRYYALPRLQAEGIGRVWDALCHRLPQLRYRPTARQKSAKDSELTPCLRGSYVQADFQHLVTTSRINLGFTHFRGEPGTAQEQRQVRLREFEIPMHGGFYLTQQCPELSELFTIGKHIEVWDQWDDLIDKVHYYLAHPEIAAQIAHDGKLHCQKNHTWAQRFKELLGFLQCSISDFN
ncbi:MAG: glycosyltransferase [Pseudanabaenaceae cyanobacterium]|jgi:spore maturation protein CgeB